MQYGGEAGASGRGSADWGEFLCDSLCEGWQGEETPRAVLAPGLGLCRAASAWASFCLPCPGPGLPRGAEVAPGPLGLTPSWEQGCGWLLGRTLWATPCTTGEAQVGLVSIPGPSCGLRAPRPAESACRLKFQLRRHVLRSRPMSSHPAPELHSSATPQDSWLALHPIVPAPFLLSGPLSQPGSPWAGIGPTYISRPVKSGLN